MEMMKMKINKEGLKIIKKYEGCILHTYKCPSGVATIGYGHTGKVNGKKLDLNCPITITMKKAESLLKSDLKYFEEIVNKYNKLYKYNFNINEFSALVSFTYNCGEGNLKLLLQYGNRSKEFIEKAIVLYNKSNGKTLNGLVARRNEEQRLFGKKVE